jgi:hypothetical protein
VAQGTEQSWIKVGYTGNLVIKDRRAVGDGTVSLAKPTTVPTAKNLGGCCGHRGRGRRTAVLTAKDVNG